MRFKDIVNELEDIYDPTHSLFNDYIQMNHVDRYLLELIVKLDKRVQELEDYTGLHKIEVE